jgi:serine/arginine repetitive matrix protein 2
LSDSSFKRARPATDGYSMKRSMRGSVGTYGGQAEARPQSPEVFVSKNRSSRFSLRSLSPSGSTFGRGRANSASSGPPVSLPSTMRGNRPDAPSLRGPAPRQAAAAPVRTGGFGRSKSAAPATRAVPKRASRFADSSDEDDAAPVFRSRFVDSSDEDAGPVAPISRPLSGKTMRSAPVRSIPRKAGRNDGDSSDLPDTDDEKSPRRTAALGNPVVQIAAPVGSALSSGTIRRSGSGRGAIGMPTSNTTTTISGGASRPEQKRRGSIMSILRRKKDTSSKVRKSDAESPARRDTPLERSKSELGNVKRQDMPGGGIERQDSNFSVQSATGGRLQKRTVPKRVMSSSSVMSGASGTVVDEEKTNWPLPLNEAEEGEHGRPSTADAFGGSTLNNFGVSRPDIGTRRATDTGSSRADLNSGMAAESPIAGKKKKRFGAIRRAFRLDE